MIRTLAAVVAVIAFPSLAWAQEQETDRPDRPAKPGSWRERYEQQDEEFRYSPMIALRAGAWGGASFEFKSTTANGPRSISGNTLYSLGLDAGVIIKNKWAIWGSVDSGLSNDTTLIVLGLSGGYRFDLEPLGLLGNLPITACISVGALIGEVNVRNFQSFDYGVGARGGIELIWTLNARTAIGVYMDARWIQFDLNDQVFAGDTAYGGGSFATGVSLIFKI